MKIKHLLLLCVLPIITINLNSQISPYFQKLKTEKIKSDDAMEWVQFGPGTSGYVEFFWCHPTDPDIMHMSPDMFNAYGTFDGGTSWQTIKDYDGKGYDMGRTYDIEFSRQNPDLGFAMDELGGLFKTTDKGKTWQKQAFSLGKAHSEIAVDISDDNNWYIGAGSFWDVKRNHRTANNDLGELRSTAIRGHIYRSADKGNSWQKISGHGLPATLDVARIIVDPNDSRKIIMAANSGIYRSTNKGLDWVKVSSKLPKDMTFYHNKNNNTFTLYMIEQTKYIKSGTTYRSEGGIYKSTDGGVTWTSITGNLGIDLRQITNNATRYYYKRTISHWLGIRTNEVSSDYPSSILPTYNRIVVNPKNPQEIYISHNVKHDYSFGPGDVWKTTDGGTNWFPCAKSGRYWINKENQAYWTGSVRKMPASKLKTNTIFAHLQHDMDTRYEIWGCRFLSINSNGDVFVSLDQQILKSTDGGENWKQIDDNETASGSKKWIGRGGSNLPGRYMLLETGVPDRKFFCSGEHGLWESAGSSITANKFAVKQIEGQNNPNGARSIATVAVHPKNPNTIYTLQFRQAHRDFLRKSTDGGLSWSNTSNPAIDYPDGDLSADHMYKNSLIIDFDQPQFMYFTLMESNPSEVQDNNPLSGFNKFGVYKTSNNGDNFYHKSSGLPERAIVRKLRMHPTNSDTIYAAVMAYKNVNGGLYWTKNKAESWNKVATVPNAIKSVNDVYIDPTNKYIYIACGGSWASENEGGVWRSKDEGRTWEQIFQLNYVWQVETSPINPNIITVVAPRSGKNINPGAYISRNGGTSWVKVNKNLAHQNKITDFKPDPNNENVFWCADWGSAWYKGVWHERSNTPSARFYILNKKNGKKIGAANKTDGAQLIQYPASETSDKVKWEKVEIPGSNYFYLKNLHSEMYFRPTEDGQVNGSIMIQKPTSSASAGGLTQWIQRPTAENYFYLENKSTQMFFSPQNDANNSVFVQRPSATYRGDNTQWSFIDVSTGKIINVPTTNEDIEADAKGVIIYPNPFRDKLTIENAWRFSTYEIFNISGQMIKNGILNEGENQIELFESPASSGMYLIKLNGEGKKPQYFKVLKTN